MFYIQSGLPLKPIFGVHAGRASLRYIHTHKTSFKIITFIQRSPGNPTGNPV